jgi:hypothetical protein
VVLAGAVVSHERGFSPLVEDDQIDVAVIVQVIEGGGAATEFHGG